MPIAVNGEALSARVGERLRTWRSMANVTITDASARLGVTKGYLSILERGERPVSLQMVSRISGVTGIPPEDLIGAIDPEPPGDLEPEVARKIWLLMHFAEKTQEAALDLYDTLLRSTPV